MARFFPRSLGFFVVTAIVFLFQVIPFTGIFLMIMQAPFWSIPLVNAGMIGIAFEASSGRVSRWWLVLPLAFYGGYWSKAATDHATLNQLTAANDVVNATVASAFDPTRHALVLDGNGPAAWLTQNFALPVAYTVATDRPEGFLARRMVEHTVCKQVRSRYAFLGASVHTSGFHDGDEIDSWRFEERFCELSMPERPELPQVRVSTQETHSDVSGLPVMRSTTTIVEPDGRRLELVGGAASPLSWIPKPVFGCALNSSAPKWECTAQFQRDHFIPIVSGVTRFRRSDVILARTLGLTPVAITERRGADPILVMQKIMAVEQTALARQLTDVEARIADPAAVVAGWNVDVLEKHPDVVASHAAAIMTGLERAAAATGHDGRRTRDSGRILARLLTSLSRDELAEIGPRLVAVYAHADPEHWLWEVDALQNRLGELGPDAAPYLVKPPLPPGTRFRR